MSFFLDTNSPISWEDISIVCGIVWSNPPRTCDVDVLAAPTNPLFTLKILLSLKTFKTLSFSVPIPILLPADTELGTVAT